MVAAAPPKVESVTARGIELFPIGLHTDSRGVEKDWTLAELQEMADAYNSVAGSKHDAPILIGHDGNTAYGWLERCYLAGTRLLGDYKQVDSQFAEGVNTGRHKKRSISIYPRSHPNNPTPGKLNIRHVAYVGVPAVKGMADHVFQDSGEGFHTYEFADTMSFNNPMGAIAYLIESMRDHAIDAGGLELAGQQFPKEAIDAIKAAASVDYVTTEQFSRLSEDIARQIDQCRMEISELTQKLNEQNLLETQEDQQRSFSNPPRFNSSNLASYTEGTAEGAAEGAAEGTAKYATAAQLSQLSADINRQLRQGMAQISRLTQQINHPSSMSYEERKPDMTTPETAPETAIEAATEATPDLAAEFADLKLQVSNLQAELIQTQSSLTQSRSQVSALESENARLAEERERERVANFVEGLVHQRKVLPAERQAKIDLALAMPHDSAVEFTEGAETVSMTLRQRYLKELAAGRELWSNSPMATGLDGAPPEFGDPLDEREESFDVTSVKLDRQIRAKAVELGKNPEDASDYADAMRALNITI